MTPAVLERVLNTIPPVQASSQAIDLEARVVAGRARNEDAAVVRIPAKQALVQSVDILAPIVNDAYTFGRIAAANALSDIYAMGAVPWCAMNMVFFPTQCHGEEGELILAKILHGGLDTLTEAETVLVGGHTVEDSEIKYGLSITGIIEEGQQATNDGLCVDDVLILTKPLGTGILATGIKARWDGWEESQELIAHWCTLLNKNAACVMREHSLKAATDITGFGLGGHAIEMALASKVQVEIYSQSLPILAHALDYAYDGLIPAGSHTNRTYWQKFTHIPQAIDPALESIIFDAQTSGGLLLAVPEHKSAAVINSLTLLGEQSYVIGRVLAATTEDVSKVLKII